MARRKQLRGIAGNLAQWCLSRNFDSEGYWAVGKLYAEAQHKGISAITLNLIEKEFTPKLQAKEYAVSLGLLSKVLECSVNSSRISESWIKSVVISFEFEVEYVHKWHYWGSALGKPFKCRVSIESDLNKEYAYETGCNVWVHNPKRECRRYGF
ncbi:hypothetical protein [uncultured Pseudoteredinibacter sp.]|uniref:hypothetical protein n=1 Tax=uncultured Pseudoteredinibacter sp. TaxID=1641701 RepID=UPI00261F0411|nr:hypothetical protein [uncultured Pseudoteredinibacter sp.]